jgi:LacI family transcriptional regulator
VTSWLESVPKPIGVLGHDNHTGRILVDCCIDAGIDVPDQVAILGCGAEDVHIWMSQPELSYVDTGARRIGYAAAEAMHRQLAGEPNEVFTQFAPLGVVRRGSTRGVLVEHDPVAAGVRFIRDHITEKLSVQRVAEASGMSLRGLGYAFQRELGRSVHQEVLRQRVDLAKQLLATTDLPLARICQRVGFGHASKLCSLIKRYTGRTPTQYRQAKRADVAAVGAGHNGKESK